MLSRWLICVFFLPLVIGTVETAGAQPAPDYTRLNRTLDTEIVKRRAELPQQMGPELYMIKVERLDKTILYTAQFTTVDPRPTAATRQKTTTEMIRRACNDPEQRKMMEWGYAFTWLYLDARNSYVARVYVDFSKC
jgi:hypothetical protein